MSSTPFRDTSALSIVDESAIDNGDDVYTSEELSNMDPQLLRRLAANANTNCINGKSVHLEIKSYFGRQRTLPEFDD